MFLGERRFVRKFLDFTDFKDAVPRLVLEFSLGEGEGSGGSEKFYKNEQRTFIRLLLVTVDHYHHHQKEKFLAKESLTD